MLIQELLRTCANRTIAAAAVSSIGHPFSGEVTKSAAASGMTAGDYAAAAVREFARTGGEAELRSVASAMAGSQEPILAGLRRVLCIMLVADCASGERYIRDVVQHMPPQLCALGLEPRRESQR